MALVASAAFLPVPYVTMSPGPTVNVLGSSQDKPIIDVRGARRPTRPTGDLRLTTVSVTDPTRRIRLAEALKAWLDPKRAVVPAGRDLPAGPDRRRRASSRAASRWSAPRTPRSRRRCTSSATSCRSRSRCSAVTKSAPADGKLEARDRILRVNGTPIRLLQAGHQAIQRSGVGKPATLRRTARERHKTLQVTPKAAPDDPKRAMVGVQIGTGYDFPFDVSGAPSARTSAGPARG